MKPDIPGLSIAAFVFSGILVILYCITIALYPIIGESLASTLQVVEALVGLASFAFGVSFWAYKSLKEPETPIGVREFHVLFPRSSDDEPEIVREWPRLIDFDSDYIVKPPETYRKLIERLWVSEGDISSENVTRQQSRERFRAGVLAGPSGCGKTVTGLKLGYDLSQKGWQVYFSESVDLFMHNSVTDIRDWFSSLRGKKFFIIDNTHLNIEQTVTLLVALKDIMEKIVVVRPSRFRFLCIHAYVHFGSLHELRETIHTVAGKRVALLPTGLDDKIGLSGTTITTVDRSGDLIMRFPTLQIMEGREIAQTIFNRFHEVENTEPKTDFETLIKKTGTVVELCEVLRGIKQQRNTQDDMQTDPPWMNIPEYALARRISATTNKELGVLVLGIVSTFSQVGSVVAKAFVEQLVSRNITETVNELIEARHLVSRHIGESMREHLIISHPIVAGMLRKACATTLGDLYNCDEPLDIDLRIYREYLEYIKTMPRTASKMGSTFLLALSSRLAHRGIEPIVDFVAEQSRAYHERDRNIAMSLFNVGVYHFKHSESEMAEEFFLETIDLVPDFMQVKVNLGALYYFNNELEKARDTLEEIPEEQRDASVLGNLGLVLHAMGESEQGIEKLNAAVTLQPQDAKYWHNLAKVEADLGMIENAQKHFLKAIELDSENGEYYASLSAFFFKQGLNKEAEELLQRALDNGIVTSKILINLGVAHKNQGGKSKAKELFTRCLEFDPSSALAHANLADLIHKEGNSRSAERHAREAIKLDPALAGTYALLGLLMQEKGKLKDARKAYEEAISKGYETHEVVRNLAFAYYELKKPRIFEEKIERAIELAENPAIVLLDASLFLGKKNTTKAREYHSRATKLVNKYLGSKDLLKAESALDKLSTIHPKQYTVWANLGSVHALLGRFKEARTALEKATSLESNDPGIWHNLGNVYKELNLDRKAEEAYNKARQLKKESNYRGIEFDPDKGWNLTS